MSLRTATPPGNAAVNSVILSQQKQNLHCNEKPDRYRKTPSPPIKWDFPGIYFLFLPFPLVADPNGGFSVGLAKHPSLCLKFVILLQLLMVLCMLVIVNVVYVGMTTAEGSLQMGTRILWILYLS